MSYVFFAFVSAICFAFSCLINKFASKHAITNRDSLLALFMINTGIFALLMIPFLGPLAISSPVLTQIIISQLLLVIGYYFFYTGLLTTDASTVAPLFQLQALITKKSLLILKLSNKKHLWASFKASSLKILP